MPPFVLPLALTLAYLIGSVPFAVVVSRAMALPDPRSFGSGNPGATNVMRTGSRKAAALTLLGDAGKGALVVVLGRLAGLDADALALCGVAAFVGHVFSVFLGFKGGKGVATAAGVLLALDPRLGAAVCTVWLAAFMATRISAAGAISAGLATPALAWLLLGPGVSWAAVTAISAVMLGRHQSNIRQWLSPPRQRPEK
ncbi:MAG: glycerol-3-phosphate 1-O-acyltransferase PlsY [Rhodocyclaceae bacterium]|nr:glycerol-3-phosphate 1-O-acyltransferase PlsY [Rhodocyclaceae bacterium]